MTTVPETSLAGQATVPSYMSESDAAAQIGNLLDFADDEEESPAEAPAAQASEDDQSAEEAPAETEETEEGAQPAEDAEPEAESEDPQYAHGNMKTRLRDGSEMTIGELKKLADEARDLKSQQTKWQTDESQRQAVMQQIAQRAQQFDQGIQAAIAILQENMPPAPDRALLASDPIEYITQKENFEAARAKLGGLLAKQNEVRAHAQTEYMKQQEAQKAAYENERKAFYETQRATLFEKMPEFQDRAQAQKFYERMIEAGTKHYGFKAEEMTKVEDYRLIPIFRDAMAYRALQSKAPVAQAKAKAAVPVKAPGRQVTKGEVQDRDYKARMEALRKSGSQDDAAALIMDLL